MAYNSRYQYETSPRKLQPEYRPERKKYPKKSTARKTAKPKKVTAKQTNGQIKMMAYVAIGFMILFAISYRNSIINEKFSEIKTLKSDLSAIQKENEQLEVNIENGLNLQTVEQSAKEMLGMQKLDKAQTVYINLPKQDYVEPATEEILKIKKLRNLIVWGNYDSKRNNRRY